MADLLWRLLGRLRIALLTCRDLVGYCDPPFWPTFRYGDDPRLAWMKREPAPTEPTTDPERP